jgi:hypothetical protein
MSSSSVGARTLAAGHQQSLVKGLQLGSQSRCDRKRLVEKSQLAGAAASLVADAFVD